jgi:hypothetical protein
VFLLLLRMLQCGKLEPLVNFDGPKRSCRARLERRKLPPKRSMTWTAGSASSKASSSSSSMALLQQQQQQQQQLVWEQQQARMLQQFPGASSQGLSMAAATAATPFAAAQVDGLEPACTAAALSAMPALDRGGLMQQMLLLSEQKTRLQAMRANMVQYQGISPTGSLGPPTPGGFLHLQVPNMGYDTGSPSPSHITGMNAPLHAAGTAVPGTGAVPGPASFGNPALHPAFSSSNRAAGQFATCADQQLKAMQAQATAQLQQPTAALSASAGTAGNSSWPYAAAMPGFKSAPASKPSSLGGQSGSIAEAMADLGGLDDCDDLDLFAKPDRPGLSVADALASEFAAAFPELELGMGDSHEPMRDQHPHQLPAEAASQHRTQQKQSQVQMLMQQAQLMQQQMQLTAAMGAGYVPHPSASIAGVDPAAPPMVGMFPCSSSAGTAGLGGISSNPSSAAVSAWQQGRSGTPDHQELQLQQLLQTVQVLQESIRELSVRVHGRDPPVAPTSSPGTGSVGSFGGGPGV